MFIQFGLYNEDLDDSEEDELDEKHLDLYAHRKVNRNQILQFILANLDLTDYTRGNMNVDGKVTLKRAENMVDRIFF